VTGESRSGCRSPAVKSSRALSSRVVPLPRAGRCSPDFLNLSLRDPKNIDAAHIDGSAGSGMPEKLAALANDFETTLRRKTLMDQIWRARAYDATVQRI
jgi:hypothetical protein